MKAAFIAIAILSLAAAANVSVPPSHFLAIVGDWNVTSDHMLQVDGRQWIKGQPSAGLAAKARTIYGAKHEEFIDSVKAYAYFPYAVAKDVDDFPRARSRSVSAFWPASSINAPASSSISKRTAIT
jgi:hypothetical protein